MSGALFLEILGRMLIMVFVFLLGYALLSAYLNKKNRLEFRKINLYPRKEKTMSDHMRDAQDIFEIYPPLLFNWKGTIMDDIFYVTENPVRLQAIKVTRENIIRVAQWADVQKIHIPTGPKKWYFYLPGGEEVELGDFVIRGKNGEFFVESEARLTSNFTIAE